MWFIIEIVGESGDSEKRQQKKCVFLMLWVFECIAVIDLIVELLLFGIVLHYKHIITKGITNLL